VGRRRERERSVRAKESTARDGHVGRASERASGKGQDGRGERERSGRLSQEGEGRYSGRTGKER
jgi:hypothetical protein